MSQKGPLGTKRRRTEPRPETKSQAVGDAAGTALTPPGRDRWTALPHVLQHHAAAWLPEHEVRLSATRDWNTRLAARRLAECKKVVDGLLCADPSSSVPSPLNHPEYNFVKMDASLRPECTVSCRQFVACRGWMAVLLSALAGSDSVRLRVVDIGTGRVLQQDTCKVARVEVELVEDDLAGRARRRIVAFTGYRHHQPSRYLWTVEPDSGWYSRTLAADVGDVSVDLENMVRILCLETSETKLSRGPLKLLVDVYPIGLGSCPRSSTLQLAADAGRAFEVDLLPISSSTAGSVATRAFHPRMWTLGVGKFQGSDETLSFFSYLLRL